MNRDRLLTIVKILGVAACLYLFLVGIGGMGYSFKLFGKEFSQKILEATSSPLIGLFIGILATTIVQSSSTTTSIIIGMVAAEAIGVRSAIFMVMGANIGTTVTGLLAALAAASAVTVLPGEKIPEEVVAGATVAFAHLLFNLAGALIFLPFAPIRALPVKFAEWLAELCLRNRVIPIVFIVLAFYLIPIAVTWNTIAGVLRKGKVPEEQTLPRSGDANSSQPPDKNATESSK